MGDPDPVELGSSLAADDALESGYLLSTVAWYGITTAMDHLLLAADDLTNADAPLRPSAFFTVTRAALLGASQSVWVLTGNRTERLNRARSVMADERKLHATFLSDYTKDPVIAKDVSADFLTLIEATVERLDEDKKRLLKARADGGYKGTFESTAMMRAAAQHLAGRDDWQRRALAYEWRMSSAAAHARMWPFHVRPTDSTPLPGGGGEIRRLSSSLQEVVQSFGAAVLMLNEAWRLWDLRRTAPLKRQTEGQMPLIRRCRPAHPTQSSTTTKR
ncbi:hypothetical protein FHE66_02735 [Georgenia sp. 311]|uniref:hypothetical protein n=1 Tax=Georgenia sp. 311 TaxID=2585134 RepID=UPI00111237E0|nr:hypothetical protein [Georgenia sp. 311]TNC19778.1 hypothetical protein FHE66_02735 [Georgenia sp. 311]